MTTPLQWPDLVWSHFSRPRFDDFESRVQAARAAGFQGIGLYAPAFAKLKDTGWTAASVASYLADHGLRLAECEVVTDWWSTDAVAQAKCRAFEDLAYELADEAGLRCIQAIGSYEGSLQQAIDGFGQLCDRAARHGLLVGIEWLPFTNIATEAEAKAIVEGANRPNGGYCADIWHHVRGANDRDLLRSLDGEKVFAIQMNDGPRRPLSTDYKIDCLAQRVPPGDGTFDCVGFLQTLQEMGVTAPISLEVCSAGLWSGPAEDAARYAADGMRRVLAELESVPG